ncbi:hypothetical protein HaLaN_11592, partial [Haematococcus lacustris]
GLQGGAVSGNVITPFYHSMNFRGNPSCLRRPQLSQSTLRNGSGEAEGFRQAKAGPDKESCLLRPVAQLQWPPPALPNALHVQRCIAVPVQPPA